MKKIILLIIILLVVALSFYFSNRNRYALHSAVSKGDYEKVFYMLIRTHPFWERDYRGDINAEDDSSLTPLMLTVFNDNVKIAKMLIGAGADIHLTTYDGRTAFSYAISNQNFKLMEFFWEYGGGINTRDIYGNTPLHRTYSDKVAKWLIDKGAIVDARNHDGETPLLSQCDRIFPSEEEEKLKIVNLLIQNGADINAVDYNKDTALHKIPLEYYYYSRKSLDGVVEIINALVEQGIDVHAVNERGQTAKEIAGREKGGSLLAGILEQNEE